MFQVTLFGQSHLNVNASVRMVWGGDGRSLFLKEGSIPARIARLDLTTGRQTSWKNLKTRGTRPGSMTLETTMTPDGEGCAYTYGQVFNDLFLLEGLRF